MELSEYYLIDVIIKNWNIKLVDPKTDGNIAICQWLAWPVNKITKKYDPLPIRFPIYSQSIFNEEDNQETIIIKVKDSLNNLMFMIKKYERTGIPGDGFNPSKRLISLIIRVLNRSNIPSSRFREVMINIAQGNY